MSDIFDDFNEHTDGKPTNKVNGKKTTVDKKQKKGLSRVVAVAISSVLAIAVMLLFAFVPAFDFFSAGDDYKGTGEGNIQVTVPSGATGADIAAILFENDVVKSERAFISAFTADSRASSIQAGSYNLKKHMSAASALSALLDPASKAEMKITIPEGFTLPQVYDRIASMLNVSVDEVSAVAQDPSALGLPEQAQGNLEGWIAPLTYTFELTDTPQDILKKMIAARIRQLQELDINEADWQTVLTKASIVEREASRPEDYPKVARVIENRLVDTSQVNGLLQMDSTVLYGIGRVGGSPTGAQLRQDTPYNTYIHPGLPPSPISNPGSEAISGVLKPEEGAWLYFVTVNLDTGETKYATTREEHEGYVEELRQWQEQKRK